MICKIQSLGLTGINGYLVSVECFISNGLPGFEIVGLPDAAVKEARERVRAAIKSCGFSFPVSRITPVSYTHLCHNASYLEKYPMAQDCKPNGIFLINCGYDVKALSQILPAEEKRYIAAINGIDLNIVGCNITLFLCRQNLRECFDIIAAVDEEDAVGLTVPVSYTHLTPRPAAPTSSP